MQNVALAGVKAITIHDNTIVTMADINGNFYLGVEHLGSNRALATLPRLQILNPTVAVAACTQPLLSDLMEAEVAQATVLVLTECAIEISTQMNRICRANNTRHLVADSRGVFGWVFADMGEGFVTSDKDGESLKECMISSVSAENPALVTTIGKRSCFLGEE